MSNDLRTFPPGTQTTHWPGCWQEHRECAIARVERLTSERDAAHAQLADILPKYEALAAEIDAHDQATSETTWAEIERLTSALAASEAARERIRDAVARLLESRDILIAALAADEPAAPVEGGTP